MLFKNNFFTSLTLEGSCKISETSLFNLLNYTHLTSFFVNSNILKNAPLVNFFKDCGDFGFWNNLENLSLSSFSFKIIFDILMNNEFPKLSSLNISGAYWAQDNIANEIENILRPKIYSLRKLNILIGTSNKCNDDYCVELLKVFPNLTDLQLESENDFTDKIVFDEISQNIHFLTVKVSQIKGSKLFKDLTKLPYLTKLSYRESNNTVKKPEIDEPLCFPNLTDLDTHKWIVDK